MPSDGHPKQVHAKITDESDLSLEIVILLILGLFGLLFGALLVKIHAGDLPYSPDSAYGLFLVIVSFQVITMGKTPFGDLRRSWALVIAGMCTAALGMAACFIPGRFTNSIRTLVGIVLFAGGIALLIQLFVSEKKARMWIKIPGILRQLTVACAVVYTLTIASGLAALWPSMARNPKIAFLLIIYGSSFFYLAWCIWKAVRLYPSEDSNDSALNAPNEAGGVSKGRFLFLRDASLPLSSAILMLLGVLFLFLGSLLFPVYRGLIQFSPDGQLGLLLTIMAIQFMALGETPMGRYKRSWLMVIAGLVFAGLGVVSSIVPGLLTGVIKILLGALNVVGGAALIIKQHLPMLTKTGAPPAAPATAPPIIKNLSVTQTTLNFLTAAFGVSMLLPGVVPGNVIAGILVINGLILLILAAILQKLTVMHLIAD